MRRLLFSATLAAALLHTAPAALASTTLANIALPPAAIAVQGKLTPAPAGVTDLKFQDMIKLPIGPKGVEPSDKLLALQGQRVRLVGYMAAQESPQPGVLILTPMPVNLGDEDESLSDDLPGHAVFVHLHARHADREVPNLQGLIQLTGVLTVGAHNEADGHVSALQLALDEPTSRLISTPASAASPNAPGHGQRPAARSRKQAPAQHVVQTP